MGNLGSVKIIRRPPPAAVQYKHIRDQITKELKPVGQEHVKERDAVVDDFETDIEFGYRISVTQKQITLTVVVENSGEQLEGSKWTVGELWRALDKKGTAAHTITAKKSKLSFQWGGPGSYSPKTRPIGRSGGPGAVRNGQRVAFRSVQHPGFPPRKFSEKINKKLRRQFEQAIDRGVRIGGKRKR